MYEVLDNPIWNALVSGSSVLALGNGDAMYTRRDAGFFAGLSRNDSTHLQLLHTCIPLNEIVVLFTTALLKPTPGWIVKLEKPLLQMVYTGSDLAGLDGDPPVVLTEDAIPEMIALTSLTKPGPFLSRTIDFGNYEGIFEDGKLVAMAGQRLKPSPFTEVSAVCTHPDYTGKGYAARLINSQIRQILSLSAIPFLHVYPDNTTAISVYRKIGFEARKELFVYVLESTKQGIVQ